MGSRPTRPPGLNGDSGHLWEAIDGVKADVRGLRARIDAILLMLAATGAGVIVAVALR